MRWCHNSLALANQVSSVAERPGGGVVDVWHWEAVVRVSKQDRGLDLSGEGGSELCSCFVHDLCSLAGRVYSLAADARTE